jgi:hypothetical protein
MFGGWWNCWNAKGAKTFSSPSLSFFGGMVGGGPVHEGST